MQVGGGLVIRYTRVSRLESPSISCCFRQLVGINLLGMVMTNALLKKGFYFHVASPQIFLPGFKRVPTLVLDESGNTLFED